MDKPLTLDKADIKKEFVHYLAIANAMTSPLPKRRLNRSIDRNSIPKIVDNKLDRLDIRDRFMRFIREFYMLMTSIMNVEDVEV